MAGNGGTITERGEIRGILPFPPDIFVKNLVYDPADGFINGPSVYKILVISGAVCDVKAVAPVPVRRNHGWHSKMGGGKSSMAISGKDGEGLRGFHKEAGMYFEVNRNIPIFYENGVDERVKEHLLPGVIGLSEFRFPVRAWGRKCF